MGYAETLLIPAFTIYSIYDYPLTIQIRLLPLNERGHQHYLLSRFIFRRRKLVSGSCRHLLMNPTLLYMLCSTSTSTSAPTIPTSIPPLSHTPLLTLLLLLLLLLRPPSRPDILYRILLPLKSTHNPSQNPMNNPPTLPPPSKIPIIIIIRITPRLRRRRPVPLSLHPRLEPLFHPREHIVDFPGRRRLTFCADLATVGMWGWGRGFRGRGTGGCGGGWRGPLGLVGFEVGVVGETAVVVTLG